VSELSLVPSCLRLDFGLAPTPDDYAWWVGFAPMLRAWPAAQSVEVVLIIVVSKCGSSGYLSSPSVVFL
jgi:hypothetical protein